VSIQQKDFSRALLTAHSWKIKALLYRMKGDAMNEDFTDHVYHFCEKDDIYTFAADSSFTRDDNVDKCSAVSVFGLYGDKWTGNNHLTQITISNFFYSIVYTVDELTTTSFIIEQPTKDVFQNDIVYTYEFEPE
jgi:hypothetical protein